MMFFKDGFMGYAPDSSLKFSGGDAEYRYIANLENQPKDWYYRHTEITYNYNSLGHRCKNIEDINLDNYLLFTGCSHTEGIGLELEKTFPYVVSQTLGIDYYNLAIGGSGSDVMTYNLVVWLNTVKKLPRALIILWPDSARFVINDEHLWSLINSGHGLDKDFDRFLVLGDQIGYFNTKRELNEKLIKHCYNGTNIVSLGNREFIKVDLARDLSHFGIESNNILAKKIVNQIN